jgi:hypothetical protein
MNIYQMPILLFINKGYELVEKCIVLVWNLKHLKSLTIDAEGYATNQLSSYYMKSLSYLAQ